MDIDRALTVIVAACCLFAIGASGTTLESTMETSPRDVIDIQSEWVVVGSEDAVRELDRQIHSESDGDRSPGTGGVAPAPGESTDEDDPSGRAPVTSPGDGSEQREAPDASEPGQVADGGGSDGERSDPGPSSGSADGPGTGGGDAGDDGGSDAPDTDRSGDRDRSRPGGDGRQSGPPTRRGGEQRQQQTEAPPGGQQSPPDPPGLLDRLRDLLGPLALAAVLLVALAAAVRNRERLGAWFRGDADDPSPSAATWDPRPRNVVAGAWHELVLRLDLDRARSRTPREVAEAARADGYDGEAVADLTAAFEAVQYGGETVTPDRKRVVRRCLARLRDQDGGGE